MSFLSWIDSSLISPSSPYAFLRGSCEKYDVPNDVSPPRERAHSSRWREEDNVYDRADTPPLAETPELENNLTVTAASALNAHDLVQVRSSGESHYSAGLPSRADRHGVISAARSTSHKHPALSDNREVSRAADHRIDSRASIQSDHMGRSYISVMERERNGDSSPSAASRNMEGDVDVSSRAECISRTRSITIANSRHSPSRARRRGRQEASMGRSSSRSSEQRGPSWKQKGKQRAQRDGQNRDSPAPDPTTTATSRSWSRVVFVADADAIGHVRDSEPRSHAVNSTLGTGEGAVDGVTRGKETRTFTERKTHDDVIDRRHPGRYISLPIYRPTHPHYNLTGSSNSSRAIWRAANVDTPPVLLNIIEGDRPAPSAIKAPIPVQIESMSTATAVPVRIIRNRRATSLIQAHISPTPTSGRVQSDLPTSKTSLDVEASLNTRSVAVENNGRDRPVPASTINRPSGLSIKGSASRLMTQAASEEQSESVSKLVDNTFDTKSGPLHSQFTVANQPGSGASSNSSSVLTPLLRTRPRKYGELATKTVGSSSSTVTKGRPGLSSPDETVDLLSRLRERLNNEKAKTTSLSTSSGENFQARVDGPEKTAEDVAYDVDMEGRQHADEAERQLRMRARLRARLAEEKRAISIVSDDGQIYPAQRGIRVGVGDVDDDGLDRDKSVAASVKDVGKQDPEEGPRREHQLKAKLEQRRKQASSQTMSPD